MPPRTPQVKVKLIKPDDPMYHLPSPTTLGASLNPLHSSPFVSFHGFGDKPEPIPDFAGEANFPWPIQQHITFGEVMHNMTFVADNLQVLPCPLPPTTPHLYHFASPCLTHSHGPCADERAQRTDQVHQVPARRP